MFMGTYDNSIDGKNRIIIPARMRDDLGQSCVVTRGLDRCLYVYTMADWERQMEKVAELPESDPKVRAFIRHFCSNAMECELDKQGRITLSAKLKEYAGIDKELITMGAMRRVEIWSKDVWESPENTSRMDSAEFASALEQYNF